MGKRFVFVVDTEQYAGNFERWLCGYLTGRTDDPETHGGEEAAIARKELPKDDQKYFDDHVLICAEEPDDCLIHTPVVIYPTPGWFNTGMGGHFREGQESEAFEHYKKAVEGYKKNHKDSTLEGRPELTKYPAYLSVGIFFDEEPPENIIVILKERTRKFVEYWSSPDRKFWYGEKINVTGFRLLEENYGAQVLNSTEL